MATRQSKTLARLSGGAIACWAVISAIAVGVLALVVICLAIGVLRGGQVMTLEPYGGTGDRSDWALADGR